MEKNSAWFSEKDASKAESKFNDWSNREATKFEKVGQNRIYTVFSFFLHSSWSFVLERAAKMLFELPLTWSLAHSVFVLTILLLFMLQEYIPASNSEQKGGDMTFVVVSLVLELQGDTTTFDGAGYSLSGTREVLSSIASDVIVDRGACLNAVEVFWTPSERNEVLTREDVILDFPEIIDL